MEPNGFKVMEYKRILCERQTNNSRMIRHIQWNQNGIVGCGENGVWRMPIHNLAQVDDDDTRSWYSDTNSPEYILLDRNAAHALNTNAQHSPFNELHWYNLHDSDSTKSSTNAPHSSPQRIFRHVDLAHSRFLALEDNRLHVWEWERTSDSLISLKGSNSQLITSKWCPHSQDATLLAIGAENGALKILDLRATSNEAINLVLWKRDRAHDEAVRALAWNPFIPHWLASASNSGNTYLWDLRYQRDPVVQLEGHDNVVRTLSWSMTHCEMLASGGADQQVRTWSLRQEPHYELASIQSNFISPVIGVEFSENRNRNLYALSALGSLNCFNITPAFLKPLIVSRYPEKAERERNIEMKLFNRQFKSAFNDIVALARELKNNNEVERALELLDLCKVRNLNVLITDKDPEIRFKKELDEYSYYLPPNMKSKDYDRAWRMKKEEIGNLILNSQILLYVKRMDIRKIEHLKPNLLHLLESDLECLEIKVLRDVAELYLNHNYSAGIDFIAQISKIFSKRNQFSRLEPICAMIVGAHVFDAHQNPSLAEESFEMSTNLMRDAEYMLDQLEYHKKMVCALWEPGDSGQIIIDLVDNSTIQGEASHLRLFSTSLIRLYLNALLGKDRIGRFIIVTTELLQKYHGYDCEFILLSMLKEVGFPRFTQMENRELLDYDDDEDPVQYLKSIQGVVRVVLSCTKYAPYIPDFLQSPIKSALSFMRDTFDECLQVVQNDAHREALERDVREVLVSLVGQVEMDQSIRPGSAGSKGNHDPSSKSIKDSGELFFSYIEQRLGELGS